MLLRREDKIPVLDSVFFLKVNPVPSSKNTNFVSLFFLFGFIIMSLCPESSENYLGYLGMFFL
jgi:hypothetical protein